jgi:hypothetical protein
MATDLTTAQREQGARHPEPLEEQELRIYSHSSLFYWWPVWAVGFLMAAITYFGGDTIQFGNKAETVHPSQSPGVIFTITLFLVILISNITLRGLSSVIAVLAFMFLAVLFAYLGWWEVILSWLPHVSVHMNLGFYILFSTLIFLTWAFATFIYDRLSYWVIRPGQITHEFVIGGAEKSYDTLGMVFEKFREDLFRQWFLGFGSGDIKITTTGARHESFLVPNVLFVDWKVGQIQKMIAMRPAAFVVPAVGTKNTV